MRKKIFVLSISQAETCSASNEYVMERMRTAQVPVLNREAVLISDASCTITGVTAL